jgi:hypothetical protein
MPRSAPPVLAPRWRLGGGEFRLKRCPFQVERSSRENDPVVCRNPEWPQKNPESFETAGNEHGPIARVRLKLIRLSLFA